MHPQLHERPEVEDRDDVQHRRLELTSQKVQRGHEDRDERRVREDCDCARGHEDRDAELG
jgi:hypothetical protein